MNPHPQSFQPSFPQTARTERDHGLRPAAVLQSGTEPEELFLGAASPQLSDQMNDLCRHAFLECGILRGNL